MADAKDSTPPGPASSANSQSQAHGSGGFFGRRPSFFGSKSKAPKPSPAAAAASSSRTATPPGSSHSSARSSTPPPGRRPSHASQGSHSQSAKSGLPSTGLVYAAPSIVPSTPPRKKHRSRHSISASVADIGTTLRRSRSASLRTDDSSRASSSHQRTPSAILALSFSPEKNAGPYASQAPPRPALSISTFSRNKKSAENVKAGEGAAKQGYEKSPLSAVDNPKTPFSMATAIPLRYPPTQKELQKAQRDQGFGGNFNGGLAPAAPISVPSGVNPNIIFQNIQELASKRISTLDYLRKAHEGRIYWFNTLLFSKSDLTRLPSFTPRNLSRRATNYLLLGFSLPTILDLNSNSATDYLKALIALLLEFETYQSIHPPDGVTASSLSRGRVGNMFKRVGVSGGGKGMGMSMGRRSSSAASDFPLLTRETSNSFSTDPQSALDTPHPADDLLLLPNESYTYLQTPSLPFDPDFFSTFATLCDVLIDCYTKILSLLSTPESVVVAGNGVPSAVGDLFGKADAKVRKIILGGVVREFEESCRQGVRGEVGGVGKVILGGLM